MLQQRDSDIGVVQERIVEEEKVLEQQRERLEEENEMLKNEKKNNHEVELELEKLNAVNSRMRREFADLQQAVYTISNEVQLHLRTLEKLSLTTLTFCSITQLSVE